MIIGEEEEITHVVVLIRILIRIMCANARTTTIIASVLEEEEIDFAPLLLLIMVV